MKRILNLASLILLTLACAFSSCSKDDFFSNPFPTRGGTSSVRMCTITTSCSPSKGGTVSGGGTYQANTPITLRATPASGYTFSHWNDNNTSATRTIVVNANAVYTAYFTSGSSTQYTITTSCSPSNGGTVSGAGTYNAGTSVTLRATPASGYTFSHWNDNNTSATRTIVVNANATFTAYFVSSTPEPTYFSIAPGSAVQFAPGNLQYRASTSTWRFAEHQYDVVGASNSNISSSYSGWIDLFGYGTSGYNGANPWEISANLSGEPYASCDISGTQYDWGVHNTISNASGNWRTLSYSEWNYLLNSRTGAAQKRSNGYVNGVKGLILLPDNWVLPGGCSFISGLGFSSCSANTYSTTQWQLMESAGAVFLPVAGSRFNRGVNMSKFVYWTGSISYSSSALAWSIEDEYQPSLVNYSSTYEGKAVRLVKDY